MKKLGDILGLTGSGLAVLSGLSMVTDKNTLWVGIILIAVGLMIAGSTLRGMKKSA